MKYLKHSIKKIEDLKPFLGNSQLDLAISKLASGDTEQWKEDHASELRSMEYPPLTELADAMAKLYSGDRDLEKEGLDQLKEYSKKCLDIKNKWRKS